MKGQSMLVSPTYDLEADAVYLRLAKGKVARTIDLDDGTLVDLDKAGKPLGIEVISPARDWPIDEFARRFKPEPQLIEILKVQQRSFAVRLRSFDHPAALSTAATSVAALG